MVEALGELKNICKNPVGFPFQDDGLDGGISGQLLARDSTGRAHAWRAWRKVPVGMVVDARITAVKSGLPITVEAYPYGTGSTVLTGLDSASPGLLIWRSLLHWLGGSGFIGMAVAILPLLRVGGMRLFQTESSDWSDKVTPRSHVAAKIILLVYLGLTVACGLAYWWAGMTPFDALCHAFSTIANGGFSLGFIPNDFIQGLVKPFVFGGIISITACYFGLNTTGGTEGVGIATTRTVVTASISILVIDYFLTQAMLAVLVP